MLSLSGKTLNLKSNKCQWYHSNHVVMTVIPGVKELTLTNSRGVMSACLPGQSNQPSESFLAG
jgi:hypothetical protein